MNVWTLSHAGYLSNLNLKTDYLLFFCQSALSSSSCTAVLTCKTRFCCGFGMLIEHSSWNLPKHPVEPAWSLNSCQITLCCLHVFHWPLLQNFLMSCFSIPVYNSLGFFLNLYSQIGHGLPPFLERSAQQQMASTNELYPQFHVTCPNTSTFLPFMNWQVRHVKLLLQKIAGTFSHLPQLLVVRLLEREQR